MGSLYRIEICAYGPEGLIGKQTREASESEARAIKATSVPDPASRPADSSSMASEQTAGAVAEQTIEGADDASFSGDTDAPTGAAKTETKTAGA